MADITDEQPRKRLKLDGSEAASSVLRNSSVIHAATEQASQERRFGISAFVSQEVGFTCIFKQRYTDFLVNEIEKDGRVVHLDKKQDPPPAPKGAQDNAAATQHAAATQQIPAEQPDKPSVSVNNGTTGTSETTLEKLSKDSSAVNTAKISDEDAAVLTDMFGQPTTENMIELYSRIVQTPNKKAKDLPQHTSEPIEDKHKRTDAHIAVRRIFNGRIETVTSDDNRIQIKASSAGGRSNRQSYGQTSTGPRIKGKVGWDELGGEHLHFTLYKENKDTMEVLYHIASQMKTPVKNFHFAGTKDRRGVTAQRVSAYRLSKDRLDNVNRGLYGAKIGGIKHQKYGLELGDLAGNEFRIALRDCQLLPGVMQDASLEKSTGARIQSLKTHGFLNYYGLQRFGTFDVSTDDVGRRMLQGDFKGAVEGLLSFPARLLTGDAAANGKVSADDIARAKALDAWTTTHKSGEAVQQLPRRFQAENAIIRHLGAKDTKTGQQTQLEDYQGALGSIVRNLRSMYVHAYQSLVWNSAVTKRFELYGSAVVEGDLVIVEQTNNSLADVVDESGEVVVHPTGADSATAASDKFERARPLTKTEAESGRYSIFDIVLPQPGYDVAYPANAVGDFYKEFMAQDKLDPHNMRRKWRDISLSGGYRKVMARPEQVSYELRHYSSDEEQLILTDRDVIEGKTELNAIQGDAADLKTALIITMQLGSSQYATMALRELTKGGALAYKPEFSGR